MTMKARLRWPALFAALMVLAACTATINPEWVRIYNHKVDVDPDRLMWLDDMQVDSYGNLVIAATTIRANFESRLNDFALVKYSPSGDRLWAKDYDLSATGYTSDESPLALALDSQDNAYLLVQEYRVESETASSEGSVLISFDPQGNERWRQDLNAEALGGNQPMNALTVANDRVYVSGVRTQVFRLTGELSLTIDHPDHEAQSVATNLNGQILLGGGSAVSLFNADGSRLWTRTQSNRDWAFGEAKFTMNGNLVSIDDLEERGAAEVALYSPQGQQLWSRRFSAPYESFGLPGQPRVFEDNRGDFLIAASNEDGHRVAKLNAAGRVIWNKRSRKGIVRDAALKDGELFVVGGGQNGKYDRDGNRLGESEVGRYVQITTGSIALDGNRLYAGYSVQDSGSFALHVSQFLDQ